MDWYENLSAQERADADELIKNQRKVRKWEWPAYKNLGDGIGELRWKSEKKQQRLLGFFQNGVWYAVIGCTHKQQVYKPAECLKTASKRKTQIQNGEANSVQYDL